MRRKTYFRPLSAGVILFVAGLTLMACSPEKEQNAVSSQSASATVKNKGSRTQIVDIAASQYRGIAIIQSKSYPDGFGTGSFISSDTLITNRHVLTAIENAEDAVIRVVDENNQFVDLPVKSFAIPNDESMDVGIVKLQSPITSSSDLKNIKPFVLADNKIIDKVKANQSIRTVGYPGDKDYGSLWNSQGTILEKDGNFLKFTAPIAGGSSGSPLFNEDNQLIGLSNASTDDINNPMSFGFLFDSKIRDFIEKNK
ncbi:trypsin-like serine peptidase [Streptococcus cuniculi]|uniref:Serine protease n=1 Tax=Streptococcus cuniculi TaxID=1432788 RepID=A0A4Y9JC26_9STRE|nr:trypsin-like peptidase domain-containing protein [Streptococcus cuniculi]MBF0778532.1 trypsin-like peptidase domain-containing protein [Streptococcus cuniculi]TFU97626.1 trypsin-like serine protease [Streptococcus cuniculi]